MASRGRVNVSSIHRLLHAHLASLDRCDMKEFLAKESEVVSYGVLDRYVRSYLRKNPLQKLIIQRGEDGAVSAFLPALGVSNHRVNSINQIVEIDATSLDAIIDTSILARELGLEVQSVEAWQACGAAHLNKILNSHSLFALLYNAFCQHLPFRARELNSQR